MVKSGTYNVFYGKKRGRKGITHFLDKGRPGGRGKVGGFTPSFERTWICPRGGEVVCGEEHECEEVKRTGEDKELRGTC